MADNPGINLTPAQINPVHRYTPSSGPVLEFKMRAWHTVQLKLVFWDASGAPDKTGAQSSYNPADLTDIVWLDEG